MSPTFILEEIQKNFGATLLSHGVRKAPSDIDIYISQDKKAVFLEWIKSKSYIAVRQTPSPDKLFFFLVYQSNVYFFDVTFSINYLTEYFRFKLEDLFDVGSLDQVKIDGILTLKYFLLRRNNQKAISHVLNNKNTLEVLPANVFYKKRFTDAGIEAFVSRKPFGHLYLLKPLDYIYFRLRQGLSFFRRFNTGKIYAVVGPDGSGKSLVVSRLSALPDVQSRYMGDKDFIAQVVIERMSRVRILKPLSFIVQIVLQWARYIEIRALTLRGTTVICDRYPGFNSVNAKNQSLYDLIYRLYPQPHKVLFIEVESDMLKKRRPELNDVDIQNMKKVIKDRLVDKRDVLVRNDSSIDHLLTTCLRELHMS